MGRVYAIIFIKSNNGVNKNYAKYTKNRENHRRKNGYKLVIFPETSVFTALLKIYMVVLNKKK